MGITWAYVRGCRVGDTLAMGSRCNEQQWIFGGVTENEFVTDHLAKCKKKKCQICAQGHEVFDGNSNTIIYKSRYRDLATGWAVQGSNTDRDEDLAFY